MPFPFRQVYYSLLITLNLPQSRCSLAIVGREDDCRFSKTATFLNIWSTKLGGTVQATKKMTHNDYGPGPGQNYRQTAIFTSC